MTLAFDQSMHDLANEIRKTTPTNYPLKSKHNDANLLLELLEVYENSESVVLNTLISELFTRAGTRWEKLLTKVKRPSQDQSAYQELIEHDDRLDSDDITTVDATVKKQMYRGQVVEDLISKEASKAPAAKRKQTYRGSAV